MSARPFGEQARLRFAAVLVVAAVGTAAALTIGAVRHGQRRAGAVAELQVLRADMFALSQLEWRGVAEGGIDDELAAEIAEREERFGRRLRQVRSAGADDGAAHAVEEAGRAYLGAYDELIRRLADGDLEAAEEVDEERVDPAFEELEEAAAAAGVARTSAAGASRVAVAVAGALVPLCALGVLAVVRRESRRWAAGELARAERASARRFEAMVRGASDLVVVTGADGVVGYASPAAARVLGVDAAELLGGCVEERVHDADRAAVRDGLREVVSASAGAEATLEYRALHADGSWRVLEARLHDALGDPAVAGVVWNVRDVTDRRALEGQLAHQAFHDVLTGLANRALLTDRMDQALARNDRRGAPVAAVVVDLDGFKDVNDSLGHAAGDDVIAAAAARLRAAVRPGDTVARLGGDEFALLLEEPSGPAAALEVARRAVRSLAEAVCVAGRELHLTASAGVAVSTGTPGADRAEALVRDADVAMYEAKKRGKNQAVVFEESMRRLVQDRLDLAVDVRAAAARGQIRVLYQPLVDLATGAVAGFEALARWHHPTRGVVPPATFIPLAEDTGTIGDIGRHVLRTACAQAAAWTAAGDADRPVEISVNLSGRQLADEAIVDDVRAALADGGLAPGRLVLEITESAVLEDLTAATRTLRDLRALGVRIAMDDFGTGYSSLSYLRRLPIDILKIDKSFLDDRAGRGPELFAGVAALGATLGLLTVAEGVEGLEQLDQVRTAGCDYGQGYHFARPLTPDDAGALLTREPAPVLPALVA